MLYIFGRLKLPSPPNLHSAPRSGTDLAKLYTRLAPIYGFWGAATEARARERALQAAALRNGESVLEVAVGTGTFFAQLAATPGLAQVTGIDLAEGMIRRASRLLRLQGQGLADLCRADTRALPVASGVFDVLFNCYLLDLLCEDDIRQVLGEFRRVLKPSGRLVALVMARQAKVVNSLWMGLYGLSPSIVGGCRPVPLLELLNAGAWQVDVKEQISQCGFRSALFVAHGAAKDP
jgi:ubiquinone/menaquinone biosynthesis C-methylase UbiE